MLVDLCPFSISSFELSVCVDSMFRSSSCERSYSYLNRLLRLLSAPQRCLISRASKPLNGRPGCWHPRAHLCYHRHLCFVPGSWNLVGFSYFKWMEGNKDRKYSLFRIQPEAHKKNNIVLRIYQKSVSKKSFLFEILRRRSSIAFNHCCHAKSKSYVSPPAQTDFLSFWWGSSSSARVYTNGKGNSWNSDIHMLWCM